MDIQIRIAGQAGQGVKTTGAILVEAFGRCGLHVLADRSYMSRIRGGLNWYDVRIAGERLYSLKPNADLLVALSEDALDCLTEQCEDGAVVMFDGAEADDAHPLPFTDTANEVGGSKVMANTVAAGAIFAILGYDADVLYDYLKEKFAHKDEELADKNVSCARAGAKLVADKDISHDAPAPGDAPTEVYEGSQAVAISAAVSGVKFATAYPMTPATAVFTNLANMSDEYSLVAEQAEDEIAAINMVCGAVYAGVPAMTMTSGGGFALMVEGVSLAAMMELPIVAIIAQRPGPATGLPTRTAQQDLKFVLSAGHGEFPRAIYAPGSIRQCYDLTRRAVQTAHKHQSPVFILTDRFIIDLQQNTGELDDSYDPIDRCIVENPGGDYIRHEVTESGVSPRAIPGGDGFVRSDSDEHDSSGHIAEDLNGRIEQQDKRMNKFKGLKTEIIPPEEHGKPDAGVLVITWGSTLGPAIEALERLGDDGLEIGMLHFSQVWPLDAEAIRSAVGKREKLICIEGNQTGQFASMLREIGAIGECELVSRYDGMPFTGQELAEELAERLK